MKCAKIIRSRQHFYQRLFDLHKLTFVPIDGSISRERIWTLRVRAYWSSLASFQHHGCCCIEEMYFRSVRSNYFETVICNSSNFDTQVDKGIRYTSKANNMNGLLYESTKSYDQFDRYWPRKKSQWVQTNQINSHTMTKTGLHPSVHI